MEPVVKCINLEKKYFLFDKDYKIIPWLFTKKGCLEEKIALTNINLTINKGDVIGFVGKNGAGKSTLMKIVAGITMHTDGDIKVNGKVNSLINLGAGFNPKYTGRENIYYKANLMGMEKKYVDTIIDEIIDFCELGDYFDLPTYMYSSGMNARLGFALAIYAEHDILIVDEVFAVGDKAFREKSASKMQEILTSGKSIIFASHADEQIRQFCNRAIFIDQSRIAVDGTVEEALNAYNKKYEPNKVQKMAEDFENEIDKSDDFMQMINTTVRPEKADLFREMAILHEYEKDFTLAYYYMSLASELRPNGNLIIQKIDQYKKLLNNSIEFVRNRENSIKNITRMLTVINNRNNPFNKPELYRELGVFYELENDLDAAYKYMLLAKELRPNGPFICDKVKEYKLKIK